MIDGSTPLIGTPPPFMSIGANATGVGSVLVEGAQSRLLVRRDLVVGGLGQGTLTIRDHGLVQILDNPLALSTIEVGPYGRIELDGGTLFGSTPDPAAVARQLSARSSTATWEARDWSVVRSDVGEDASLEARPATY